jgi:hypothetical protein
MDTILKKANCCSDKTYNNELVAKTMYVLLNAECINDNIGLYKKLDTKFKNLTLHTFFLFDKANVIIILRYDYRYNKNKLC